MISRFRCKSIFRIFFLLTVGLSVAALAQTPPIRGVYTSGFSATEQGDCP